MALLMNLTNVFTGVSVLLLLSLLFIYVKNLRKVSSKLLIGLVIFVALFLIQNLVSLYYYITMMAYYVPEVALQVFVFSALQTIAFAIMLWISLD